MINRAQVLGLLLHSIFDHGLCVKFQKQMAEAELKQKFYEKEDKNQQQESPEILELQRFRND